MILKMDKLAEILLDHFRFLLDFSLAILFENVFYIFYIFPFDDYSLVSNPPHRVFTSLIPMTIIVYFQRFFIAMLIAFTAFWIDQSNSLTHLKWMLGWLVSGSMLPLTFFPDWFQTLLAGHHFIVGGFSRSNWLWGNLTLKRPWLEFY